MYSLEAYSCASKYAFARTVNKLNHAYLKKDLQIVNFDSTYINDDSIWSSNNKDCLVLMRICFYAFNLVCLSLCPLPLWRCMTCSFISVLWKWFPKEILIIMILFFPSSVIIIYMKIKCCFVNCDKMCFNEIIQCLGLLHVFLGNFGRSWMVLPILVFYLRISGSILKDLNKWKAILCSSIGRINFGKINVTPSDLQIPCSLSSKFKWPF